MGLFDNIRDAWRTAEDLVFDTEREKERRRAAESLARTNQQISQGQGFKYGVLANPQARQNFVANNQAPQFSYSTALKQAAHSALTDPSQYADSLINVGNFKGSGIIEDFLNSPMNTAQGIATVGSGHVKEGLGKIGTSLLEGPLGFVPLGRATEVGLKAAPAITSIAKAGLKQGAKEGAVFGGIYGAADAAEQNKSPLEIAKSTGIGTLLGGGGGAVLGGTTPLVLRGGKELFNLGLKGAEKGAEWTARQLDNFLEDEVRPTVIEHPEPPPPPPTNNNPTPPPQTAPEVVNRQGADSIAEVIRERQQPNNLGRSVVDELAARYGGTPNAINQNIDRFGLDLTNNMYARKSDSPLFNPETGTGIKDIDAVVTSELAKQNPNAPRVMSPEEMASLEATAPPPTVDEVARVQGITRPEAEQRIADLSTPDNAPNKLLQEASAEVNPAIPNKPTISQRVENVLNNPPANLRRMESNYDIENKDPLAALKQEALKYKSADEFVEAKTFEKGSTVPIGDQVSFEKTLSPQDLAIHQRLKDIQHKMAALDPKNGYKPYKISQEDKAFYSKYGPEAGKKHQAYFAKADKAHQQLTDLYNQAHAEAKTGQEASKYKIFQEIEEDWRKEDIARMNELELKIKNSVNTASGLPVESLKEYYSLLNKYGKKEAVTPPDQTHAGVKTPKATTDETPYFAAQRKNAEKQANEAVDNLISEVEARGHRVDDILRKMQEANRGLRQLTPEELESANLITNRMNQAREKYYASIGQPVPETNQPFYAPQAKKGTVKLPQTREEMYDLKYENPRLNKIDLDEMDYNKDPLVDYIMRAENRDLLRKSAIEKAAIKDKRVITPEQIERVAQKTNELFDKLAPENGSGKAVKNDTSGDFYNIGKDEGYKQGTNDYKPSILDQTPLNIFKKAGIYDRGIEQYHNAEGYATHFVEKMSKEKVSPSDIGKQLYRELRRIAPKSDRSSTSSIVGRTMIAIENRGIETSAEALPFIQNAMRQAAKADLIKYAKTTNITDKKLRAVFNETLNNIIARDAYGQSFGKNLDKFLSERLNVSLRGANILSAAFELGDFANIGSNYGAKFLAKAQKGALGLQFSKRYGLADTHYMSADIPEVSKMNQIFSNPNWNMPRKIYEAYRTVENKLLVFKYVEQHKTEVFLRASEAHYKAEGLTGKALVDRVMDDYYKTMLPRTILTANRLIGKLPNTLTQYLDWSIQATNRLGRTISGSNEAGRFANQSRVKRVARGTTTELVPKVVAAGIVGVPIMQILGMRDFTGATQGDFTGISDEDKTKLDTFMSYVSLSPILSLGTNAYFADRRNDIAARNKAQGKTYGITPRPEDTTKGVTKSTLETFVPFHSQIKKSADAISAYKKGYYENKQGRVQALADNKSELPLGVVFGKGMTPSFREYQDNPDLAQVLKGKAKPQDLLTKNQSVANVAQTFNLPSPRNYNRPLTDDYTTAFKDNPKNLRNEILTNGRDYNRKLDDLKRSDPTRYANYIQSLDGNHVNPEFWRQVMGGNASEGDLTVFKMMQSRKKQLYADMTKYGNNKDHKFDYDPIYNLNDEQARQVLQMKSTATGEDLALSNILYKEDWFKKYKDAETKFYNTRPASDKDFFQTARLKDWSKLNDQYSGLRGFGKDAGLINKYPLVVQQKAINDKYGYGSQQSKDWFKANADAYKAQKDQYDGAVLAVINKMRKIEGVGPMSAEAYAQATNIENTDDKKKKTYASSSGRGSKSSPRFSSSDSAIDDIIREVAGLQSKDFDKFRRPTLKTVSKPTTKKISPPKMNKKLTVKKTMRRA